MGERKRGIAHFINSEFPLHIYLSFWVSHSGPSTRSLAPFPFWRPTRPVSSSFLPSPLLFVQNCHRTDKL